MGVKLLLASLMYASVRTIFMLPNLREQPVERKQVALATLFLVCCQVAKISSMPPNLSDS